jgi:hypothetical protein
MDKNKNKDKDKDNDKVICHLAFVICHLPIATPVVN